MVRAAAPIKIKLTKPESALCVIMYMIPKNKIMMIGITVAETAAYKRAVAVRTLVMDRIVQAFGNDTPLDGDITEPAP